MSKEKCVDFITRIDERMKKELDEIKENRKERGYKINSDRFLTNLIVRHKNWELIREDLINYGN